MARLVIKYEIENEALKAVTVTGPQNLLKFLEHLLIQCISIYFYWAIRKQKFMLTLEK